MVNVMTGSKLHRTDSKFLQIIIHNLNLLTKLPCFSVSAFAVSLFFKNMYILILCLNSGGSWIFSPNLINGCFLRNKASENSSINKQVFSLYTPESCLWKLQVIRHNQVYFHSILPLFWLVQAIQQSSHSRTSPWWWLLYQSKHWKNWSKLG